MLPYSRLYNVPMSCYSHPEPNSSMALSSAAMGSTSICTAGCGTSKALPIRYTRRSLGAPSRVASAPQTPYPPHLT